ncbi:MAG: hypothetical protein H7145_14225 [Akkermansiaceae bacterium]|nr:hypothetical protein [Armatimonadota bacterium]
MPFRMLDEYLKNPHPPDLFRLVWVIGGFVITALLIQARVLFPWWPLHPAGFALAHAGFSLPWVWFPILLGWVAKSLIMRCGGMQLYRRGIPFFIGLILGDIFIACVWSLLFVLLNMKMYMFFPG